VNKYFRKDLFNSTGYKIEQADNLIKVNQNESPFDIPAQLKKDIIEKLLKTSWNLYPDIKYSDLISSASFFYNVDSRALFPARGSNEILYTLFNTFARNNKVIIITEPSYSMYRIMGSMLGIKLKAIPLYKNFSFPVSKIYSASRKNNTGLIILCSPNNPTGNTISESELTEILENSKSFIAIDEAYAEFSDQNFITLTKKYNNLIIIRTMSKALSAAALRIGWIISNPDFISKFRNSFLPYHVDSISATIASELIKSNYFKNVINNVISERTKMYNALSKIKNIKVFNSKSNFFLIEPCNDAFIIFQELKKNGILVRNVSNYHGLSNHLRISVGTSDQNNYLIKTIREIV